MNQIHFWVGVVSKAHVLKGVEGGFCQFSHGKKSAVDRLRPGDWTVYYSPRQEIKMGETIQAFTAIGQVLPGDPYPVKMSDDFMPYRRGVRFELAHEAPIKPLLPQLSFIKNKTAWSHVFRSGLFQIPEQDFRIIAAAMKVHAWSLA